MKVSLYLRESKVVDGQTLGGLVPFDHIDELQAIPNVVKTIEDGSSRGTRIVIYNPTYIVAVLCEDDETM